MKVIKGSTVMPSDPLTAVKHYIYICASARTFMCDMHQK